MQKLSFQFGYVYAALLLMAGSMLTSVAGINLAVLLLLLAVPLFIRDFAFDPDQKNTTVQFLLLIGAICFWDIFTNLAGGASVGAALWAVQHDLRTFAFVVLLWPVFASERVARFALWSLGDWFCVGRRCQLGRDPDGENSTRPIPVAHHASLAWANECRLCVFASPIVFNPA